MSDLAGCPERLLEWLRVQLNGQPGFIVFYSRRTKDAMLHWLLADGWQVHEISFALEKLEADGYLKRHEEDGEADVVVFRFDKPSANDRIGPKSTEDCAAAFNCSTGTWRNWAAGKSRPKGLHIKKASRGLWYYRNEAQ